MFGERLVLPMYPNLDWHRLLIVVYHDSVLHSLLGFLGGSFVLWALYAWQGRAKLGLWGFPCWFPFMLSATVGTALLLRRITGPVAVAVHPTMYLYPLALAAALLTQPAFKAKAAYVVAHLVMGLAILAGFLWLMWFVVEPLMLQY